MGDRDVALVNLLLVLFELFFGFEYLDTFVTRMRGVVVIVLVDFPVRRELGHWRQFSQLFEVKL